LPARKKSVPFNFDALRKDPKPLIGYSDLTALFLAITTLLKIPVFYGPVVAELGSSRAFHGHSLWRLLKGEKFRIKISSKKWILQEGRAEGRIIGGCLTLISNLLGTEFEPDFQNKILFLEEVGEEVYRIERLLNHLRMTGKFQKLKGVIVGEFIKCPLGVNAPGRRGVKEIIEEYFGGYHIPILFHFPAGHCRNKITVPLGGRAAINTKKQFIEFQAG
jgi:muramoyltetrapeptide carboxypeptidase